MQRIKHDSDQNIFDVVLQNTGVISSLFEFMKANKLTELNLQNEALYNTTHIVKKDVVDFFSRLKTAKRLVPSTSDLAPFQPPVNNEQVRVRNTSLSFDLTVTAPAIVNLEDITVRLNDSEGSMFSGSIWPSAENIEINLNDVEIQLLNSENLVIDNVLVKVSGDAITLQDNNITINVEDSTTVTATQPYGDNLTINITWDE